MIVSRTKQPSVIVKVTMAEPVATPVMAPLIKREIVVDVVVNTPAPESARLVEAPIHNVSGPTTSDGVGITV